MIRSFFVLAIFSMLTISVQARTLFVATTGNDTNAGTESAPFLNIQKAVDEAVPGDLIYLRGGTYMLTKRVKIEKAGTADKRICLWGYPGERVIIDGSAEVVASVNEFKQARCIYVNHFGNYWHFKNLELCNAKDNGMKLEGSYCIVENCKFHDNNDTGLQLGMYKDFSIEETQSFPISGEPAFNPGYSYCKYNVVINCDSWYNYDSKSFSGSDDGGDADGFACKLFPGPGTEFHGCRAWNNSDDNWDLYMVYHPIVIDHCWSWNAGKTSANVGIGNGNGFKLGGGGTSGGAAFAQSVGAHVVRNCVAFDCLHKGFDQNNAYEAMYLFNNVSFGNEYNYRFPTILMYGSMYLRNNIGFKASTLNHEFLSADKEGAQLPNTTFNSWTTFDGCDPYKDGNKVNGVAVKAQDYSAQFKSLSPTLFLAERQADGSLPENDFCKLVSGSKCIDAGEIVENFLPEAHSPGGLTLPSVTILYNDGKADMGAFETGLTTTASLSLVSGRADQSVFTGAEITTTLYRWGGAATSILVRNLPAGLSAVIDSSAKTATISGQPLQSGTYTVSTVGGTNELTLSGRIVVSLVAPAAMTLTTGKAVQEVFFGNAMIPTVFAWSGGASDVAYTTLPAGITALKDDVAKTLTLSGTPTDDGTFVVSTLGGMEGSTVSFNCNITRVLPTKVLTGDWYHLQDSINHLPTDLQGVLTIGTSNASYPTVLNPSYVESGGTAPSGCTIGAINVERSGGYAQWTLPSLAEMKLNLNFTGTRTLNVEYTVGGVTKTWTSASLSKQTMLNWDLMLAIGLEPTKKPVTIKFINTTSSGGIRIYDFFLKTYDLGTGLTLPQKETSAFPMYQTESALIVYGDIARLQVFTMSGNLVAQSTRSRIVDTNRLSAGVYLVKIEDAQGKVVLEKFIKK